MADVASTLRLWSTTAGSNGPAGTATIGAGLDDNLRQLQATVRQYLASKGSDMASATTVDLSTADGSFVDVTGTTTITGLGTEAAGISYLLRFTGILTFTHNGTSLILPGAANITTANGDMALMTSLGSGNWKCAFYMPSETALAEKIPTAKGDILAASAARTLARVAVGTDGKVLTAHASATAGVQWASPTTLGTESTTTGGTSIDFTIPSGAKSVTIMGTCSSSGTSPFMVQLGDSGGIENANYTGGVNVCGNGGTVTANSSGFLVMEANVAANTYDFVFRLNLESEAAFRWYASGECQEASGSQQLRVGAGKKALSAELTTVRLTTSGGTDTIDSTILNVSYKF